MCCHAIQRFKWISFASSIVQKGHIWLHKYKAKKNTKENFSERTLWLEGEVMEVDYLKKKTAYMRNRNLNVEFEWKESERYRRRILGSQKLEAKLINSKLSIHWTFLLHSYIDMLLSRKDKTIWHDNKNVWKLKVTCQTHAEWDAIRSSYISQQNFTAQYDPIITSAT